MENNIKNKKHWWQELPLTISAVQVKIEDSDDFILNDFEVVVIE